MGRCLVTASLAARWRLRTGRCNGARRKLWTARAGRRETQTRRATGEGEQRCCKGIESVLQVGDESVVAGAVRRKRWAAPEDEEERAAA